MSFWGIDEIRARELADKLDSEFTRIRERGSPFPTLTEIVESVGQTSQERYFIAWLLGRYEEANRETKTNDDYHR